MSLLVIIISLILEKLLPTISSLRSLAWIASYQQWIRTRLAGHEKWHGVPSLLIIILLPVIAIGLTQHWLNDVLILLGFIFSIVVLTYCLGPKDKHQLVHDYLDAQEADDQETVQATLQEIVGERDAADLPEDKTSLSQLIMEKVLIQNHDYLLAILFWFVVLGPMGAVLYRLCIELLHIQPQRDTTTDSEPTDADFHAAVERLYYVLAWIPSRLTELSYAVMGSFTHALHSWQDTPLEEDIEDQTNPQPKSHRLLIRIGMASLQLNTVQPKDELQQDEAKLNEAIRETLGLCGRSLIAWITILAIMTLAGWAS